MLRPIDMTMAIQGSSSSEAQKAGIQTARPEVANQAFVDNFEKQVKMQEQSVMQSNKSEQSEVQADREGNGGGYNPKRKNSQKKEPAKKTAKPMGESLYDIKI